MFLRVSEYSNKNDPHEPTKNGREHVKRIMHSIKASKKGQMKILSKQKIGRIWFSNDRCLQQSVNTTTTMKIQQQN